MTLAERLKYVAHMFSAGTKASYGITIISAFQHIEKYPEEKILFECLVDAVAGKTETYWGTAPASIPDSLKNEGFWVRREEENAYYLSFDTPPENSTTAEPTA